MRTVLRIACQYCRKEYGLKDGQGVEGTSHGICLSCWEERYPDNPYPVSLEMLQQAVNLAVEKCEILERILKGGEF